MTHWVKTSDGLPDNYEDVLLMFYSGRIIIGEHITDGKFIDKDGFSLNPEYWLRIPDIKEQPNKRASTCPSCGAKLVD